MRLQDVAERSGDRLKIHPDKIVIREGINVRPINQEHVKELAESIRVHGVRDDLLIFQDGEEIVLAHGEHRLRAVRLLQSQGVEIKLVPIKIFVGADGKKKPSPTDLIVFQFADNSTLPLTQIERAEGVRRLIVYGWTKEEIGQKIGLGVGQVSNLLTLSAVDPDLKQMIEEKKVSPSLVAREVKSKGQEGARQSLTAAIKSAGEAGKPRATPKHIPRGPRAIDWNTWGPKLLEALRDICSTHISSAGPMIATAKELLDEMGGKETK